MNALLYIPPLAEGGGDVFGNLGINGVMRPPRSST